MQRKATLEYEADGEMYARVPITMEFDWAVLAILNQIIGVDRHMDEIDAEIYHDIKDTLIAGLADLAEGHFEACRRVVEKHISNATGEYVGDLPAGYDTAVDVVVSLLDHYKDYEQFRREGRHVPPYTC